MKDTNASESNNIVVRYFISDEELTPETGKKYKKKYGKKTWISPGIFGSFYVFRELDLNSPFAVI